jgi:(R,R)-butanediol dehydrogenase/meso-butanediol dehydrogenase/diacetyl reductase
MLAVTFTGSHRPRVADVAEPLAGPAEVVIEVGYCGICGSDLHASAPEFRKGVVMGHEFAGEIVEVGPQVSGWRTGERVSVNPNGVYCGTCTACLRGLHNLCPRIWDHVVGLARPGGMTRYVSVPSQTLHRLPDSVSTQRGAWAEPVAVALRTVRRSEISVGESAIVFGAGPIGLLVTQLLKTAGAAEIAVVEPNPVRASLALSCGATSAIDPGVQRIQEMFPDPLAAPSHAFECTGIPEVMNSAVAALAPRGRVTVTGLARSAPVYRPQDLLFKEIEIRGSFIYDQEFDEAISLLARGVVDVDSLTTGVVGVVDGPAAFERMLNSTDTVKMLIAASD